ncbi:CDP-diacylglycerol--serine O-phosphatidyltransferase [Candidatus Babeliales bacterium]|nr:CDP-diacylglycerol--serine O-phosphatidyltransferase [Candidatus Babeliales bacterium]
MFKKSIALLPNLFTLGNAFFGFCSIILSSRGDLITASYCILIAALMDALDGRLARLMGVDSALGVQLDSLSDAVSFCMAPAFLIYFWQLKKMGFLGLIVSSIFLLAGLWRLAKFNILHDVQTKFFLGVPTTIAACFLATLYLNFIHVDQNFYFLFFISILVLFLAFLMVSSLRFPTFKQQLFKVKRTWYVALFIVVFSFLAVLQIYRVLLIFFLLYFLFSILISVFNFKFMQEKGEHE